MGNLLEELKGTIDKKMENIYDEERRKNERRIREFSANLGRILSYSQRIKDMIELGNYALSKGMDFTSGKYTGVNIFDGKPFGRSFRTDGIDHSVGFFIRHEDTLSKIDFRRRRHYFPIQYMGIENGGACGRYNLLTDGNDAFLVYDYDNGTMNFNDKIRELNFGNVDKMYHYNNDVKDFLMNFKLFEKAFIEYIRKYTK